MASYALRVIKRNSWHRLMVAAVAVVVFSIGCTDQPQHLDRVVIANPTAYPIAVEVSTPERDRWLGLGLVAPSATAEFAEVIDQGAHGGLCGFAMWTVRTPSSSTAASSPIATIL